MEFVCRKPEDILESGLDFFSSLQISQWDDETRKRKLEIFYELDLVERPGVTQAMIDTGNVELFNPHCIFVVLHYCCSKQKFKKINQSQSYCRPLIAKIPMKYEYLLEIKSEKDLMNDIHVKLLGHAEFEFVLNSFRKYCRIHTFQ